MHSTDDKLLVDANKGGREERYGQCSKMAGSVTALKKINK
jgi:hypothetical protein